MQILKTKKQPNLSNHNMSVNYVSSKHDFYFKVKLFSQCHMAVSLLFSTDTHKQGLLNLRNTIIWLHYIIH